MKFKNAAGVSGILIPCLNGREFYFRVYEKDENREYVGEEKFTDYKMYQFPSRTLVMLILARRFLIFVRKTSLNICVA
ncbi:MAG: hypothetical protein HQK54_01590 [Oligoflexales bacterium]|nr:hypothetical protein [Oligoflexales bacterium]